MPPNGLLQTRADSRHALVGAIGCTTAAHFKSHLPALSVKKHLVAKRRADGVIRPVAQRRAITPQPDRREEQSRVTERTARIGRPGRGGVAAKTPKNIQVKIIEGASR